MLIRLTGDGEGDAPGAFLGLVPMRLVTGTGDGVVGTDLGPDINN